MRKCIRCGCEMKENCAVKIEGAGYGIVLSSDENKLFGGRIGKPKVAICPECGEVSKLATTSSTGGLSFALQRAIVTARPKGQYRKHFYWPAIKRYYWNLLFSIPLLAHLYISELLHLLYCRLFQHNIL